MTNKKELRKFIIIEVLFWMLATLIFNSAQYRGGIVISILFFTWFILSRDSETQFLVLLSGLPFQAITKVSESLPSTAVLMYLLYVMVRLYKSRFFVPRHVAIPTVVLGILQIYGLIRYNLEVFKIVSGFLVIFFAVAALEDFKEIENKNEFYQKCAWVFVIAMIIDIFSVSIFPGLPYYILHDQQRVLDRIGRFCALNGDPNYYGQLIVVAVCFITSILVRYIKEKRYLLVITCVVIALVLSINGFRSLSKGYAFGLAASLFLVVWFLLMEGKPAKQKLLWFAIFIIFGGISAVFLVNRIIMPMITLRSDADLFTGRLDIWSAYFQMLEDHFDVVFFGAGFSNSPTLLRPYIGYAEAAHNLYIEVFGDLGITGIAMMFLIWMQALKNWRALFNNITSLFIWGFAVTSMSLSASSFDVMYFLVPIYSLICASENNQISD